jgi:hypothetical protein
LGRRTALSRANAFDTIRQSWELLWWLGNGGDEATQARQDLETLLFISPLLRHPPAESLYSLWKFLIDVSPEYIVDRDALSDHCQRAADLLRRTRIAEREILEARRRARRRRPSNVSESLALINEESEEASSPENETSLPIERDLALKTIVDKEAINLELEPDQLFFCLGFSWLDPGKLPPTGAQLVQRVSTDLSSVQRIAHQALHQPLLWHVSWDADRTLGQIRIVSLQGEFPEGVQRFEKFALQSTNESERLRISAQLDGLAITLWLFPGLGIAKGQVMVLSNRGPPGSPMETLRTLMEGELSRALRFEELRSTLPRDRPSPSLSKK